MIRSKTGNTFLRGGVHSRIYFAHTYQDIISVENLLGAWKEFLRGKRSKQDVQEFQRDLMHNILVLHTSLKNKTYKHGGYHPFKISDPKPRDIHKATVRDRLLHRAIYRQLYSFFDKTFIHDSYSCRMGKGTHKAINRFRTFAYAVSKNHARTCWVLKCDVKKFFANIGHSVLIRILENLIIDKDIVWLLKEVVGSFYSTQLGKGLPLGNLTSQLLVNIYMNEFDQYVKHTLKVKYYIRYADDFVIFSHDKILLEKTLKHIKIFLEEKLKLELHPKKVSIGSIAAGIDFLGWVHFTDHRVLRTATKRRMLRRIKERKGHKGEEATKQSYLGMLSHGNAYKLQQKI